MRLTPDVFPAERPSIRMRNERLIFPMQTQIDVPSEIGAHSRALRRSYFPPGFCHACFVRRRASRRHPSRRRGLSGGPFNFLENNPTQSSFWVRFMPQDKEKLASHTRGRRATAIWARFTH
jgi:hypothetical protein